MRKLRTISWLASILIAGIAAQQNATAQALTITSPPNNSFGPGLISLPLTATGGTGTGHTWSIVSGALPPDFAIRTAPLQPGATGVLLGVSGGTGTYNFTLRVEDSGGNSATQATTINLSEFRFVWRFSELPRGAVGQPYSQSIPVAGATAPPAFSILSGSLPPGLNIDPATGDITGVPTATGLYTFMIQATSGSAAPMTSQQSIQIDAISITTNYRLATARVGQVYSSPALTVAGAVPPISFSGCCLPAGLALTSSTGAITGTPLDQGTNTYFTLEITATDSQGRSTRKWFELGVEPVIQLLPQISFPDDNDLTEFTPGQIANQQFRASSGRPPYAATFSPSLPLPNGVRVLNQPQDLAPFMSPSAAYLQGNAIGEGDYPIRLQVSDSYPTAGVAERDYTLRVRRMTILFPSTSPTSGAPYSDAIIGVGGDPSTYQYSISSGRLPTGLSLNPTTGQITGTPLENGSFSMKFRLQDGAGKRFESWYQMIVNGPPVGVGTIQVSGADPLPEATLNTALPTTGTSAIRFSASGGSGNYNWTVIGAPLPPGLSLSSSTGSQVTLIGTPTVAGTYTIGLRATEAFGAANGSRFFTLTVTPVSFTSANPQFGNQGTPYSFQFTVAGATGAVTYSVSSGTLPRGVTLSSTGLLSGTPQVTGAYSFAVTAVDAAGNRRTQSGRLLQIYPAGVTPNSVIATPASITLTPTLGTRFTQNITLSGVFQNPPNFTATVVSGSLPPGMTFLTGSANPNTAANVIQFTGEPTQTGTFTATVRIQDSIGQYALLPVSMTVTSIAMVTQSLPFAYVGVPYSSGPLIVRGGVGALNFTLTGGTLPGGLTLNPTTGEISGTPTAIAGANTAPTLTIRVQDGSGQTMFFGFTLTVFSVTVTSPDTLPLATEGVPYSYQLTASGPGPYTFTVTSLPFGLTASSSGLISGTPQAISGWNSPTVQVNSAAGAVSVKPVGLPGLQYANQQLINLSNTTLLTRVGAPVRTNLLITGGIGPYTCQAVNPAALPPGVEIRSQRDVQGNFPAGFCAITGQVTVPGTYVFKVRITDSAGTVAERNMTVQATRISLAASAFTFDYTAPATGAVSLTPTNIQLTATGATSGVTFALQPGVSTSVLNGLTLSPSGLLSGFANANQTITLPLRLTSGTEVLDVAASLTRPSGSALNLPTSLGDWSLGHAPGVNLNTSGGTPPFSWNIEGGSLAPGISTAVTGVTNATFQFTGAPTAAGTFPLTLRVRDSGTLIGTRTIAPVVARGRISSPRSVFGFFSLPPGKAGQPYSAAIGVSNGTAPYTFQVTPGSALPEGMSLSPAGVLSGTPAETGLLTIRFTVTDSQGDTFPTATTLRIYPANAPIGLLTSSVASINARPGVGFNYTLEDTLAPGHGVRPVSFAPAPGVTLPAGVSIVDGTATQSAILTGAAAAGTYSFNLLATDAQGARTLIAVSIVSAAYGLDQNDLNLPAATLGQAYSFNFTASGGTAPYTFRRGNFSSMPVGLSLSSSGVLSGIPATSGVFRLFVEAVDAANQVFSRLYVLEVAPSGNSLTVSPSNLTLTYEQGSPAPAPVAVTIASTGASIPWSATTAGGSWLSLSAASGTTPSTVSATLNPASLAPGTYTGSIQVTSASAVNSPRNIPVTLTVVGPQPCVYSIAPLSGTISASGGSGSFALTTGSNCIWNAASNAPWLTLTSPATGSGSATIAFTAQPNTGAERSASITAGGQVYSLVQFGAGCSFTLSPPSASLTFNGGSGSLTLTASSESCPWTASSSAAWLSVNPASGTGSALLTFTAASNAAPPSRTGTITAGGRTFTVDQTGNGCAFTLSDSSFAASYSGGSTTVRLFTAAGCSWSTSLPNTWVTASSSSGSGTTDIVLTVAPNSTPTNRSSVVTIGGAPFSITQAGLPCSITLSTNNPVQPAAGGSGSITITPSASACSWIASSASPWITLSQSTGTGPATVTYTAAANPSASARIGSLTVAGQTINVNQSGTVCSFSLRSSSASLPASGGAGGASVLAASGCSWTASSAAPWLTITAGATGSGSANVTFEAAPNADATDRVGTLTIAGLPFQVVQPAASCTVTLSSQSLSTVESGGPSSFTYTTSATGCNPPVTVFNSWITVTSSTYSGTSGTVNFTVAPNISALARTGRITVGGETFTVTQAPASCIYSIGIYSITVSATGANPLAIGFTSNSAGCTPSVAVTPSPGFITTAPVTISGSSYTLPVNVAPFSSVTPATRVGYLFINGQAVMIKQNSW